MSFTNLPPKCLLIGLDLSFLILFLESQSAFVPGRLITNNVLIAHEIHHHMKTKTPSTTGLMSIKLDMSKAFDRIEWIFVQKTMLALGFPPNFVNLILKCISTVYFSFLLNGAEFGNLTPQRGLRQGDPLSPYLFIICSEVFSCLLQDLQRCNKIHGIAISRSAPPISHLFFADDTLIFGRATSDKARHLRFAIHLYEKVSGQLVNQEKLGILFSSDVSQETANNIQTCPKKRPYTFILGFSQVSSHGKYLGLPSVMGRNKKENFGFIKDKIWQRLQGWKNYHFSKADKEILIKSILQAIPSYAMSCFRFPDLVIYDIQSTVTSVWWDSTRSRRKIHLTNWITLTRSKSNGGLGFRNFKAFNLGLLAKQAWRILTSPDSLLAKIFKAKYHNQCSFLEAKLNHMSSWTWRSIMASRKILLSGCLKKIYSGENTNIWGDRWLPIPPFQVTSPIPTNFAPQEKVADLIDKEINSWNVPLVHALFSEPEASLILSMPLSLSHYEDPWYWFHSKNGKFNVKSAYYVSLTEINMDSGFPEMGSSSSGNFPIWRNLWKLRIPPRILHFTWRFLTDSLPVPQNLLRRRIPVDSTCPHCDSHDASSSHILFTCPFAMQVWQLAGIDHPIFLHQQPSVALWARDVILDSPSNISEFFAAICNGIWYSRNKKIHENQPPHATSIVASAGSMLSTFQSAHGWPERPSLALSVFLQCAPLGIHAYFDGTISVSNKWAGIGIFLRNCDGSFLQGLSQSFPGITNPKIAEALAL
ncbi:hypothetical protein DH2020_043092 [Rehmannia glutinosa]|uniref:Reverse transcriptase domain-containing protein n=1 Tax=Rehmannia glutinosa TaxID=99300 RepID=A0ABR0ULL0_REHGL